ELFRSGRFSDVQAVATEVAGGLRLDFVVTENFYVNQVRVIGLDEPPSEAVAVSVMRLVLGEIYTERKLQEALARLGQLLEEESLYQAKYDAETTLHPDTQQMDITVTVQPGPRARIGDINLTNRTPYTDRRLINRADLDRGKQAISRRLNRSAERLRNYLVDEGHLDSRVTVARGAYRPDSNTVNLEMTAVAGPKIRVEITGARLSSDDRRDLIPIYQEGAVDEDLLREGQRNLAAHFQSEGYFDAEVTYQRETQEETQVIRYQVTLGQRRELVGIGIEGNQYFSDTALIERMRVVPAGFLARGRFSTSMLQDEVQSMRGLYQLNGFQDVQVRSEVIQDYQGEQGDMFVRFHVVEGPQTLVAELTIEGNSALSDDFLLGSVNSTPGTPYSEFNMDGDRNNVLVLYFDQGFPDARVETESLPAEEPHRMKLVYRVTEGREIRVQRVLIDGYHYTRRDRIAQEVEVQPEGPLRQGDVIDTQRQLYQLGIFNRVQVAPQNPEGTDPTKSVVVLVDEARRYTIAYGGGIEFQRLESETNPGQTALSVSPRGLFEITKNNVLGRAHTLSFKGRASTLQGRGLLAYTAPSFLNRESLSFLATALYEQTRDVSTFTAQRSEAGVQIAQQRRPNTFFFRYAFRRVVVDPDSLRIDPQEIPLQSQPTRLSGPGFTWIRDTRDNPVDAARGTFHSLDAIVAVKPLGSSASFSRFILQNSSFHRLGRTLIFARSTRFGVQEPFSDTAAPDVPLPERFFAGGGYSIRGFGLNQAGPRDPLTGFPVGGLAVVALNHELRFPMPLPLPFFYEHLQKLGGALFYDAGNVFTRVQDINFRLEPSLADINSGRLNYFSHTIGFSVRYPTPVGPVRLDLSYLLNPSRFAVDDGMGGTTLNRLPRFQFFLSIGPTF
ncbi:MAG: POTRA domain-containing protein, partial [Candidatus Acidiferrales bacterium]